MEPDAQTIRELLCALARLADVRISPTDIEIETCRAPHTPPVALPEAKIAVYVFFHKGQCLKVGKVGPNSNARYTSQHYNPGSSNSNLAKSILESPDRIGVGPVEPGFVGEWVKANTDRVNILLPARCGVPFLTLAEAFLQCSLRPIYEGFVSQRQHGDGPCL
jgi:hypothetical protein